MPKFTQVIDALQWTGKNTEEVLRFISRAGGRAWVNGPNILMGTYDGDRTISADHWIVKDGIGKFTVWTDDYFKKVFKDVTA